MDILEQNRQAPAHHIMSTMYHPRQASSQPEDSATTHTAELATMLPNVATSSAAEFEQQEALTVHRAAIPWTGMPRHWSLVRLVF